MKTQNKDNCRCANSYFSNKPVLKLQSQTTHKATFKAYPIQKPQNFQPPKVNQKHYDPSLLQSSYKNAYVKPEIKKQSHLNDTDTLSKYTMNKPKNIPFYSQTQYSKSFQKNQIKIEKPPAYQYKPKNTKFEGESSYKSQFKQVKNPISLTGNDSLGEMSNYLSKKPKIAFQGQSSYKQMFKQHNIQKQKVPQYKYQPKQTKFQGQSSYKSMFKNIPKQAYNSGTEYCPIHPQRIAIK